jgi:hypothetical protein
MARHWWKWAWLVAVLWAAPWVRAEDKPKEPVKPPAKTQQPMPEADFLEFLANWDSDEEGWSEFLATTKETAKPETNTETKTETAKKVGDKVHDHD